MESPTKQGTCHDFDSARMTHRRGMDTEEIMHVVGAVHMLHQDGICCCSTSFWRTSLETKEISWIVD
jgi:hypothetical protein